MVEAQIWDLYPAALQSTGERKGGGDRLVPWRWSWWRVVRFFVWGGKRRAAFEFGGGERHVGGMSRGLWLFAERETRARVFSGFRGLIFFPARRAIVIVGLWL